MTLLEANLAFARRNDRQSIFGGVCQINGRDLWPVFMTFCAQAVDGVESAKTEADLDEAVREYCRRTCLNVLPDRATRMGLLAKVMDDLSYYVKFAPTLN